MVYLHVQYTTTHNHSHSQGLALSVQSKDSITLLTANSQAIIRVPS